MSYRPILIVCLATLGLAAAGWGQADGKIAFISHREGNSDSRAAGCARSPAGGSFLNQSLSI